MLYDGLDKIKNLQVDKEVGRRGDVREKESGIFF